MKLFARKKAPKPNSGSRDFSDEIPKPAIPTPLYQKLATHGTHPPPHGQPTTKRPEDERWEVVQAPLESPSLPNSHPPPPIIHGPSRASSFNSITPSTERPLASAQTAPRSTSPMSGFTAMTTPTPTPNKLIRHHDRDRDAHIQSNVRKKTQPSAPVALGILRALDPPRAAEGILPVSHSEERFTASESGHQSLNYLPRESGEKEKKEKRGFWGGRDKDRDKEKERERQEKETHHPAVPARDRERERGREGRREEDGPAELTRMIGYLTATASEDWALVLEVCDRASASENNAREAVRALRREFKYGEPPAQLSAARLWAIMLRNSTETFISQSTSRKFLDTLEDLLSSSKTSPVVRERLLEVVAAAAYASGKNQDPRHERDGFKGLWKRVKPYDKPDEGMPFDNDDAMFNPPASAGVRSSGYEVPIVSYQEPSPVAPDVAAITPTVTTVKKRKSPSRNRIIPPDEDIRRLFQECKIAQGNASLLSQALTLTKPEDLKKADVIKEFYMKCQSSQELLFTQIPWAAAGAARSRTEQDLATPRQRKTSNNDISDPSPEQTIEEQLFAALLAANEELIEVMRQYEDLERVAIERKAEERSRKEERRERRRREQMELEQANTASFGGGSSSRSPSPTRSRSRSPHPTTLVPTSRAPPPAHQHAHSHSHSYSQHSHAHESDPNLPGTTLAPPPAAPHGPRSPAQPPLHSRTPSPTPRIEPYTYVPPNGMAHGYRHGQAYERGYSRGEDTGEEEEEEELHVPSAKALGKRKLVEPETPVSGPAFDPDDIYEDREIPYADANGSEPDFEDDTDARWRHPPVKFAYDAVAERSRQLQAMGGALSLTNGTH
ncbi:hypothetical protein BJ912DRAFT_37738 [Pholiota molesta]|nr:hypothetical protein BJ912DRAFT_37738 [Pholiota molesta]